MTPWSWLVWFTAQNFLLKKFWKSSELNIRSKLPRSVASSWINLCCTVYSQKYTMLFIICLPWRQQMCVGFCFLFWSLHQCDMYCADCNCTFSVKITFVTACAQHSAYCLIFMLLQRKHHKWSRASILWLVFSNFQNAICSNVFSDRLLVIFPWLSA